MRILFTFVCLIFDICFGISFLTYNEIYPEIIVPYDGPEHVFILIHGNNSDERQFRFARQYLSPTRSINIKYEHSTSIEQMAEQVKEMIDSSNYKTFTLVGKSMGGLIASYYAEFLHNPNKYTLSSIVTVGTPFQGAPLLDYFPFTKTQRYHDMTPSSSFLNKLNKRIESSLHSYVTIGSKSDIHVPEEYSFPLKCKLHQHISMDIPGHVALNLYPLVFKTIKDKTNHIRR